MYIPIIKVKCWICNTYSLSLLLIAFKGTDSLFCGKATAGQTVHRTVCLDRPFESALNTKSPTPKGVGLFVAVLNLMYIFICVLVTVKPKRLRVTIAYGVLHL